MKRFFSNIFFVLLLIVFLSLPDICSVSAGTAPSSAAFREDYNSDGRVDIFDVLSLLALLRTGAYNSRADYDRNSKCNIMDLIALLAGIREGRRTPLEPEPVQPGPCLLTGPLVVCDKWPECTSLLTWTRDIFRLDSVLDASETRRGISLFTWLRLFSRSCYGGMPQAFEGPGPANEDYVLDAHKNLFVYGWGWCDTHSRIAEALWREWTGDSTSAYRVNVRWASGGYHTMYRLRLDGRYGAFDALYGYYLIDRDSPDARILDWSEVGVDSNITRNEGFANRSRPFFEIGGSEKASAVRLDTVYWNDESQWVSAGQPINQVFASPKHELGTEYHDMNWSVPRGTTLKRYWNNLGGKFYVPGGRLSDFLPSGRFYRVSKNSYGGNWPRNDPNYLKCAPYLEMVPSGQGYPEGSEGDSTVGQAWGKMLYSPDLGSDGFCDALVESSDMLHKWEAPYLIPARDSVQAEAVFDFYCPFILVDGVFSGEMACGQHDSVSLEMRTLHPKNRNRLEPDQWSPWQTLASGNGAFEVLLDRRQYALGQVTVHGKYRFQLRLCAFAADSCDQVGLSCLRFDCSFENGIMSIPRLVPGLNNIFFKVDDPGSVKSPVRITYHYTSAEGAGTHNRQIPAQDIKNGKNAYAVDTPGLVRCDSLIIVY